MRCMVEVLVLLGAMLPCVGSAGMIEGPRAQPVWGRLGVMARVPVLTTPLHPYLTTPHPNLHHHPSAGAGEGAAELPQLQNGGHQRNSEGAVAEDVSQRRH